MDAAPECQMPAPQTVARDRPSGQQQSVHRRYREREQRTRLGPQCPKPPRHQDGEEVEPLAQGKMEDLRPRQAREPEAPEKARSRKALAS